MSYCASITKKALGPLLFAALAAFGQAPAAPVFDVASVKPAGPLQEQMAAGKLHIGMSVDAARVDIGSMTLAELIPLAFGVKPYQVTGPGWMKENRFDILAKMPEGATKDQVPQMLQALLAERFKLEVHRESKDQAIYALVVAKGGPKLKESAPDADAPPPETAPGAPVINTPEGQVRMAGGGRGATIVGGPMGPTRMSMGPNGAMHMESSKMTMPALADLLARFVARPVIDATGLKGNYQVGLDLSMEDMLNAARAAGIGIPPGMGRGGPGGPGAATPEASEPASSGTIFQAVQQLGLKLEPRKAPVETIVVDHLEKTPTEN